MSFLSLHNRPTTGTFQHMPYLIEVCEKVSGLVVSQATICRLLKRYGLTRKKIRQVALQRSDSLRGSFMTQVLLCKRELFVWVDETGCDRRDCMRKYGYALRGETPEYHRILVRGQRISAIAADGPVAIELRKGSVDSEHFYDFIRGSLIPQMYPFDGSSPKSIVIMDDCSVRHVLEVKQLFDAVGMVVFFLPPIIGLLSHLCQLCPSMIMLRCKLIKCHAYSVVSQQFLELQISSYYYCQLSLNA